VETVVVLFISREFFPLEGELLGRCGGFFGGGARRTVGSTKKWVSGDFGIAADGGREAEQGKKFLNKK
jgi:hypothetical protein